MFGLHQRQCLILAKTRAGFDPTAQSAHSQLSAQLLKGLSHNNPASALLFLLETQLCKKTNNSFFIFIPCSHSCPSLEVTPNILMSGGGRTKLHFSYSSIQNDWPFRPSQILLVFPPKETAYFLYKIINPGSFTEAFHKQPFLKEHQDWCLQVRQELNPPRISCPGSPTALP